MTHPKELIKYFKEIPKQLRHRACIAGGAVLNLKRANDVDIFILRCKDPYPEMVLVKKLAEGKFRKVWGEECDLGAWSDKHSSDKNAITFTGADGKTMNVICDEAETVQELLNSFDISTAQWAVDMTGGVHRVATSTEPDTPIVVFYISRTTLERVRKYAERFGTGYVARRRS